MSDIQKWQDFYSRNFTPWDSGKPEPHLVAAFRARAGQLGVEVSSIHYSSDEDQLESDDIENEDLKNDIFEALSTVMCL